MTEADREAALAVEPLRLEPPLDERERAFQRYLGNTVNYNAAIEAAGDEPWHQNDIERRRELFMRRYQRPEAPEL